MAKGKRMISAAALWVRKSSTWTGASVGLLGWLAEDIVGPFSRLVWRFGGEKEECGRSVVLKS